MAGIVVPVLAAAMADRIEVITFTTLSTTCCDVAHG
jgi:hypothetical protein